MWRLRFTAFKDRPDRQLLESHARAGYHLYRDRQSCIYFLEDGDCDDLGYKGFAAYDRVLNIPYKADFSALKKFKKNNKALLFDTTLHDEILTDALALSATFSTRVLCVYSDDEDSDVAVTAENGQIRRLRLKAGRKQGARVDDNVADKIETEIKAVRILADGETPGPDDVFEYTAYEVIQTDELPLSLNPYWQFREGEIGGQTVFETLSHDPPDTEPNLMFRNAFLEFEEAFGKKPPDFTDLVSDIDRFELVEAQASSKVKGIGLFGMIGAIFKRPKLLLAIFIGLAVIANLFSGEGISEPKKLNTFADHCQTAGGILSGENKQQCDLEGRLYKAWNLPGQKGERRVMILKIGPERVECTGLVTRQCLVVEGELFYDQIEGYRFKPGQETILPVERIQTCDPDTANDCPMDGSVFRFRKLLDKS